MPEEVRPEPLLDVCMISKTDIEAAYAKIKPYVRRTPILDIGGSVPGFEHVTLKLESLQHSGSFKARGAFNGLLSGTVPASGVIAASGGNHGAAVAYAAQALGIPAEIFVPTIASPAKVARIARYGAQVRQVGAQFAESLTACEARRAETGALSIHAYDQASTVVGQGSVGLEFAAQAELDVVLVAVGGGGLISGIAAWYAGTQTKVIAVEPENAPTLHAALKAGQPVDVAVSGIAADSLGAKRIGNIAFEIARQHVASSVLVTDAAIKDAQRWLWQHCQLIAEPGGATVLAALLSGVSGVPRDAKIGLVICGANCEPGQY